MPHHPRRTFKETVQRYDVPGMLARAWTADFTVYRFYAYAAVALVLFALPRGFSGLVASIYAYLDRIGAPNVRVAWTWFYYGILAVMALDMMDAGVKRLKRYVDKQMRAQALARARADRAAPAE